ncbi:hypothetical protein [Granulicella aggregans]|nr:hypothetical protein [Granulicella aggregans]
MSKKTGLPSAKIIDPQNRAMVLAAEECRQPAVFVVGIGVVGSSIGAGYACDSHGKVLALVDGFVVTKLDAA